MMLTKKSLIPILRKPSSLMVILLLLCFLILTQNRTQPLIYHHDWNTILWANAADNYERYGLVETRLQQISNLYPAKKNEWNVNQHHPPGISIITWLGQKLSGDTPFALRFWPITASILTAALLFNLTRRLYNSQIALLSTFFFSFTPLIVYFSGMVNHEEYLLPLMLLSGILYLEQNKKPSAKNILLLSLITVLGGFIGWAWYLFIGLLGLYTLVNFGINGALKFRVLWLSTAMTAIGLLILGFWQQPTYLSTLINAILIRTTNTIDYPITNWPLVVGPRLLWLPTPVVALFACAGLWMRFRDKTIFKYPMSLLFIIALTSIIYNAIFWQATYIHDYLIYYLIAPLAIWAAVGFLGILYAYGTKPTLGWRLVLSSLLILFLISSFRWTQQLYQTENFDYFYNWGITLQAQTEPDQVILTNFPYYSPHLGYYAQRKILYEQQPTAILAQSAEINWGAYIYCTDETPAAWLQPSTFDYKYSHQCYLITPKAK